MLSFLNPYLTAFKLAGIAILAAALIGFWMYFRHLESEVTLLNAQMTTATQTIKAQNDALTALPKEFANIRVILGSIQGLQKNQETNFQTFSGMLDDLENLAKTNPSEAQPKVNQSISDRLRCIAIITGSMAVDMDKANTLCASLAGGAQ